MNKKLFFVFALALLMGIVGLGIASAHHDSYYGNYPYSSYDYASYYGGETYSYHESISPYGYKVSSKTIIKYPSYDFPKFRYYQYPYYDRYVVPSTNYWMYGYQKPAFVETYTYQTYR